jgi:hypothetical protein
VVGANDRRQRGVLQAPDEPLAVEGVALDLSELLGRQPARLTEDLERRSHLAHVVHGRGGADQPDGVGLEPQFPGDHLAVAGDAARMSVGVGVTCLKVLGQPLQRGGRAVQDEIGRGQPARGRRRTKDPRRAADPPLLAPSCHPAPQHQVGEEHVARARPLRPQARTTPVEAGRERRSGEDGEDRRADHPRRLQGPHEQRWDGDDGEGGAEGLPERCGHRNVSTAGRGPLASAT